MAKIMSIKPMKAATFQFQEERLLGTCLSEQRNSGDPSNSAERAGCLGLESKSIRIVLMVMLKEYPRKFQYFYVFKNKS